MSPQPAKPDRARAALAGYLRLLAACIEDEADVIETDDARADAVLRRFRDGVLSLSLQEAPLDVLIDRGGDTVWLNGNGHNGNGVERS
jgi:hypothetical protein